MSVAVEEMLHMSLGCNMLHALGQQPQLYLRSPSPYPSNLPCHSKLAPDGKKMALPLAKLSLEQLGQFLDIEFPATADAPPEGSNWDTIGQIYSYVRCIISSCHIRDEDFLVGAKARQIHNSNYSPSNIDTIYPKKNLTLPARFRPIHPVRSRITLATPTPGTAIPVGLHCSPSTHASVRWRRSKPSILKVKVTAPVNLTMPPITSSRTTINFWNCKRI